MKYRLYSLTKKTDSQGNTNEAHNESKQFPNGGTMKINVFYFSITGNTKKTAEAIAGALNCKAERLGSTVPEGTIDLLVLGSSIHRGEIHNSVKLYISGLDPKKIKKAAVFSTGFSANAATGMKSLLRNQGILVEEKSFTCKGRFLFFNWGHPSSEDLEKAKEFAKSLVKK
jgi:flavodoxin